MAGQFACIPEKDDPFLNQDLLLRFSTDTISFDTIFSNTRNITKRLRVYNPSNNTIVIQSISLAEGEESLYELIVNGRYGKSFANQQLLGKDSLLVLVEINAPVLEQDDPKLLEDAIVFSLGNNPQRVRLESWGQDVVLYDGQIIDEDTQFSAVRPYLIRNSILIAEEATLSISPGTRIYNERESFILVEGVIRAEGTLENPILFGNSRLDSRFANSSGQWGGIVLLESASANSFVHCTIRNARFGINVTANQASEEATLYIGKCIIQNMTFSGLISLGSNVVLQNSLISNCGAQAVAVYGGGSLSMEHCTLALPAYENFREDAALLLNDASRNNTGDLVSNPLFVSLHNNIIYGSRNEEVEFALSGNNEVVVEQSHNLVRSSLSLFNENNSIRNQDPLFINIEKYQYGLKEDSPARAKGQESILTIDLFGKQRGNPPDLGAISFDPDLLPADN